MANTKTNSSKNIKRQPAQNRLPFKTAVKKRVILRQMRIPLGPKIHIQLQLRRTPKTAKQSGKSLKTRLKNSHLAALLVAGGLAGTIFFAIDIVRQPTALVLYAPPAAPAEIQKPTAQPKPTLQLNKSEPVRLLISDVGIDAPLTSVGKRSDNTLEVPKETNTPGWYRLSPTPGELGPSVIVGHVDSESGPAVFWRLRELAPGKIIEIKRADASQARFEVVSVRQFEQNNFPTQEVYGNIDHAGLRLITCGGTFNRITRHYSHNTVVYAKLVEDPAKVEQIKREEPFFKKPDFNVLEPWANKENVSTYRLFTPLVGSSTF